MSTAPRSRHRIGQRTISALGVVLLAATLLSSAVHGRPDSSARLFAFLAAEEIETASFADERGPPLFGMQTEPLLGGEVVEKWTRAKAEIIRDLDAVARCRAHDVCSPAAQKLIDLSSNGEGRSGRAKLGLINRAVDLAISPADDQTQWGVADHWSAPFETLNSNRGDCEDYAIVKYLALRAAGISQDDVKIIILRNVFPEEDHAAVAARVDGEWLILDNRILTLVRDTDIVRATPRFVLDHQGARRFVWASKTRRSARIPST